MPEERIGRLTMDLPHNLIMEGREKLHVTGVEDVESFDEAMVVLDTTRGHMTIKGEDMHVERLNLENGEINLTGEIQSIEYDDDVQTKGGFWSRLFR